MRDAIIGCVALFLLAPVFAADHLPLLDGAAHAARLAVLDDVLIRGQPSPFYTVDTLLLPNVAFDVLGLPLAAIGGPLFAERVFFAVTLILTFTGVLALSRAVWGRITPVAFAGALLIYNLFTILGFLSYAFGIGLMFWALAGRLWLERRAPVLRFAAGAVFGVALLFCHLSAFGVYAVMLAGIGLDAVMSDRRAFPRTFAMGCELIPAALLYLLMSTGAQGGTHYDFPLLPKKILDAVKTVSSGDIGADVAFLVCAIVVLIGIALGRPRIARPLVPGMAMLALLYCVLPQHVSGGSYVDSRIPVVIALLLTAAIDVRVGGRRSAALVVAAALTFVAKQGALTVAWGREDAALTRIDQALNALPDGAVIVQAECQPDSSDIRAVYASRQPPLSHVAAYAAFTDRRFVASNWTIKGQQTIATRPDYARFQRAEDAAGASVCSLAGYQALLQDVRPLVTGPTYLLLLRPPHPAMLAGDAPLIETVGPVEIYRVGGG